MCIRDRARRSRLSLLVVCQSWPWSLRRPKRNEARPKTKPPRCLRFWSPSLSRRPSRPRHRTCFDTSSSQQCFANRNPKSWGTDWTGTGLYSHDRIRVPAGEIHKTKKLIIRLITSVESLSFPSISFNYAKPRIFSKVREFFRSLIWVLLQLFCDSLL